MHRRCGIEGVRWDDVSRYVDCSGTSVKQEAPLLGPDVNAAHCLGGGGGGGEGGGRTDGDE